MSYWADLFGYTAYLMIFIALPWIASDNKRVSKRGWTLEFFACLIAAGMGIAAGLTSVIVFNLIFAYQCLRTILRLKKEINP